MSGRSDVVSVDEAECPGCTALLLYAEEVKLIPPDKKGRFTIICDGCGYSSRWQDLPDGKMRRIKD